MTADTVESQKARVAAVKAAGHTPMQVRELGYERSICRACLCNWPCPDFAQAAEWRA